MADKNWLSVGFIFLCELIGFISKDSYVIYNCVIGFLTLFFIYKAVWDMSKNSTMSLFLLFCTCLYLQTFNQSRQMLAIAIVFYNYKYLINNNFKKYLLFTLIATSIHSSAIIMLPFYFISKQNVSKNNIVKYSFFAIGCIVFFPFIEKIISSTNYGTIYSGTGYYSSNKSSLINLVFRIALLLVCLIFGSYTNKRFESEEDKKMFNIGIWCVIFQIITTRIYILGRITTYFFIAFIILLPNIYMKINNKKYKKIFFLGVVSVFLLYHFVYFKSVAEISGYDIYNFYFINQ